MLQNECALDISTDHFRIEYFPSIKVAVRNARIWCHSSHIGVPKQWNSGQVGIPNQSCGSSTLFLCKHFLCFIYLCDVSFNSCRIGKHNFFPRRVTNLYACALVVTRIKERITTRGWEVRLSMKDREKITDFHEIWVSKSRVVCKDGCLRFLVVKTRLKPSLPREKRTNNGFL